MHLCASPCLLLLQPKHPLGLPTLIFLYGSFSSSCLQTACQGLPLSAASSQGTAQTLAVLCCKLGTKKCPGSELSWGWDRLWGSCRREAPRDGVEGAGGRRSESTQTTEDISQVVEGNLQPFCFER